MTSPTTTATVWLTRAELAARWRIPVQTLATWAASGKSSGPQYGPKFSKLGRHVRYRLADVEAWEASQESSSNAASEAGGGAR